MGVKFLNFFMRVLSLLMEANRNVGKNELADPFSAIAYNNSKGMTGSVKSISLCFIQGILGKLAEFSLILDQHLIIIIIFNE